MSTEERQRPPRLRNACLVCTSAKVKCSGEKTGCSRCTKNGSNCVYLESMAGRVPRAPRQQPWVPYGGIQHARSPQSSGAQSDSDSPSGFSYMDVGRGARPSNSTTSSSTVVDSSPPTPLDYFLLSSTPKGFPGDATALNSSRPIFQLLPTLDPTPDVWSGIDTPEGDYVDLIQDHDRRMTDVLEAGTPDIDALLFHSTQIGPAPTFSSSRTTAEDPSSVSATASGSGPTMFSASPWTDSSGRRQLDKQCVLATTQIINVLENTIDNPTQPLDMVLEIVHKADVGLNGLIGLQQQSRQQRCLALFGVILDQILVLIETHVWRLEMDGGRRGGEATALLPAHSAVLHQLDSVNELISSYLNRPDAHPASEKFARARRLLAELECCLRTASRAMSLADRTDMANVRRESYATPSSGRSARSNFEVTEARLGLLRQRLYNAIVKMVSGEDTGEKTAP